MKNANQSFTKLEHEAIHAFREAINLSEGVADVLTLFSRTVQGVLLNAFDNQVNIKADDVTLTPEQEPGYALNETLLCNDKFQELWLHSDLPQIVARFASSAEHRYKYLKAHHEKHKIQNSAHLKRQ